MRSEKWQNKTYRFRTIGGVDPRAVEQEAHGGYLFPLTIAEGVHELGELGRPFDFEEDLVVVVGDFDVEMLGFGLLVWVAASGAGGLVAVGHFVRLCRCFVGRWGEQCGYVLRREQWE